MKTTASLLIALLFAFSSSSCSHLTPQQRETATAVGRGTLTLVQGLSDAAVRIVFARAESSADLTDKANLMDSVAGGLRSIEVVSGGIVTTDQVKDAVRAYTDPTKIHWADFADAVAEAFANSPLPVNEKLETLAATANIQAAGQRSTITALVLQ